MDQIEITTQLLEEEFNFQRLLNKAIKDEEHWMINSRSLWLKAGDQNTSFFHKEDNARVLRNNVRETNVEENTKITEYEEIKEAMKRHFQNLYTQQEDPNPKR